MRIYRALFACALTACTVPDYFLVDGRGSSDGGQVDAKADAMPDAEPGAATVRSVSSTTGDGFYRAADVISIQVLFSEAVTVDTTGGQPQLALNTTAHADYSSGSGTATLTFTYRVTTGESSADLDYASTTALSLNGGTIKNGTVNASLVLPAPGSLTSLGGSKALVIDAVAPLVGTITGPGLYSPSASASLAYSVTETNVGTTTCMQTAGTGVVTSCSTTGAMFSGLSEGNHTISITHTDAAGNVSTAKTFSWTVDTVVPVVSNVTGVGQYSQSNSASLSFSVTETNPGTTNCTMTMGTGVTMGCTGTGASFMGLSEGLHTVSITHTDLAGQTSTPKTISWTVDTLNPSFSTTMGPPAFANSNSGTFTYTLTEANPGTTSCSFSQGTGTIASCSATGVTLSGLNEGPHVLSISHTDLAGRTGGQTYTWTVDTVAPVVSAITGPTGGWTPADTVSLTYTITDANLMTTMCNHTNGTGTQTVCDNTTNTYTTLSVGSHDVTIKHTDKAGNSATKTITFSSCPPRTYGPSSTAYTFTVPSGCGTTMEMFAWGGGGAGGNPNTSGGTGGGGGFVSGRLNNVSAGAIFKVNVGGGGKNETGGLNGGGNGGVGLNERGGGGGGWSAVFSGPNQLVQAGGGGGGGGCVSDATGGGGGDTIGGDGGGASSMGGKGGQTLSGPGAGGANGGSPGNGVNGGAGAGAGQLCGAGGGGGGSYGGGGGGSLGPPPAFGTGGGGGGSSLFNSSMASWQIEKATGSAPGGRSDPHYQPGVGVGAVSGTNMPGGDGMVIVHVHP